MIRREYKAGDIVFGPFPYVETADVKDRVFLIIGTPNAFRAWGLMISSVSSIGQDDGSVYELNTNDFKGSVLPNKSGVRMSVLQTIETSKIRRKATEITGETLERILNYVNDVLNA
ncbi:MAG: type II toxin-antitoxin system PemK/MazF family toxin [Bacteroidia bacterium]|jgi:hypothetical protein|nr:type II toxin-antitoxin system PemK/MazF family toxin [Bacteroidia bacterium]